MRGYPIKKYLLMGGLFLSCNIFSSNTFAGGIVDCRKTYANLAKGGFQTQGFLRDSYLKKSYQKMTNLLEEVYIYINPALDIRVKKEKIHQLEDFFKRIKRPMDQTAKEDIDNIIELLIFGNRGFFCENTREAWTYHDVKNLFEHNVDQIVAQMGYFNKNKLRPKEVKPQEIEPREIKPREVETKKASHHAKPSNSRSRISEDFVILDAQTIEDLFFNNENQVRVRNTKPSRSVEEDPAPSLIPSLDFIAPEILPEESSKPENHQRESIPAESIPQAPAIVEEVINAPVQMDAPVQNAHPPAEVTLPISSNPFDEFDEPEFKELNGPKLSEFLKEVRAKWETMRIEDGRIDRLMKDQKTYYTNQ